MNVGWVGWRFSKRRPAPVWEMNQYRTSYRGAWRSMVACLRCRQHRGRNREHSFQVGGRFGPVGRAKEVAGHLLLDHSVRLGPGRIS